MIFKRKDWDQVKLLLGFYADSSWQFYWNDNESNWIVNVQLNERR